MAKPEGAVSIASKFAEVAELWSPRIVAEFNGLHVKLARVDLLDQVLESSSSAGDQYRDSKRGLRA